MNTLNLWTAFKLLFLFPSKYKQNLFMIIHTHTPFWESQKVTIIRLFVTIIETPFIIK